MEWPELNKFRCIILIPVVPRYVTNYPRPYSYPTPAKKTTTPRPSSGSAAVDRKNKMEDLLQVRKLKENIKEICLIIFFTQRLSDKYDKRKQVVLNVGNSEAAKIEADKTDKMKIMIENLKARLGNLRSGMNR